MNTFILWILLSNFVITLNGNFVENNVQELLKKVYRLENELNTSTRNEELMMLEIKELKRNHESMSGKNKIIQTDE